MKRRRLAVVAASAMFAVAIAAVLHWIGLPALLAAVAGGLVWGAIAAETIR